MSNPHQLYWPVVYATADKAQAEALASLLGSEVQVARYESLDSGYGRERWGLQRRGGGAFLLVNWKKLRLHSGPAASRMWARGVDVGAVRLGV